METDDKILGPILEHEDKITTYIMQGCIIASLFAIAAVVTIILTYNLW